MYVKMMFLSSALLEVNDELQCTNVYRHRLKKLSNELSEELLKVMGKDFTMMHHKDDGGCLSADIAISDISSMLAQMTLNDWLHTRDWVSKYLETPDVERLLNKAAVAPIQVYKANDIVKPE